MSFLERLDPGGRDRFLAAGHALSLMAGAYLVRRGDAAGDLFLLEQGELEVIDTATGAATILATIGPGGVVGEVSFLDDAPRTADVRARTGCVVRRWAREDVRALADREPTLAAQLYEEMARALAGRVRSLHDVAAPRSESRGGRALADVEQDLVAEAADIADRAKEGLQEADEALRARPFDPGSARLVRTTLDRLDHDLRALYASRPAPDAARTAARRLRRELRPWLARSSLAERCLRDQASVVVTAELLGHVAAGVARGEGLLGTHVDRWLLDRPSLVGRRLAEPVHVARAGALVGGGELALLIDALVPARLDALADALAPQGAGLVLVDPSGEALGAAEARLAAHAPPVRAVRVQEGVVRLALGRVDAPVGPCRVTLAFGLVNYLPDRIATSVLRWAVRLTADDGRVLLTVVDEGGDEALLAHVLGWPTVRRTPARVERLAASAGLRVDRAHEAAGPVRVVELVRA